VFVDSIPPRVTVKHSGGKQAGSPLRLRISDTDIPRGMGRSVASGVASIEVKWGDGKSTKVRVSDHTASHLYARRGRFSVTVTVKDKAGNKTIKKIKIKVGRGSGKSHKAGRSHTVRKPKARTSAAIATTGTGSLTSRSGARPSPSTATTQTATTQTATTPQGHAG
jgi:phage terminase large subunit-like protein